MPHKIPAHDDPKYADTHQEGFLEKQASDDPKKFQRRWFCTVDCWLAYAHSERGALDAKKAIDLQHAEDIFLSSLRIVNVKAADGRTVRLRAEDPEEARVWIKVLLARRRRLNRLSTEDRIKAAESRVAAKGPTHRPDPYAARGGGGAASGQQHHQRNARAAAAAAAAAAGARKPMTVKEKLAAMEARMERKLLERGLAPAPTGRIRSQQSASPSAARRFQGAAAAGARGSAGAGGSSGGGGSDSNIRQMFSTPGRVQSAEDVLVNPFFYGDGDGSSGGGGIGGDGSIHGGNTESSDDDDDDDDSFDDAVRNGSRAGASSSGGGDDDDAIPFATPVPYADGGTPNANALPVDLRSQRANSDLHLLDAAGGGGGGGGVDSDSDGGANPFADDGDGDGNGDGDGDDDEEVVPAPARAPQAAARGRPGSMRISRSTRTITGAAAPGADGAAANPFADEGGQAEVAAAPRIAKKSSPNPFDDGDSDAPLGPADPGTPFTPAEPAHARQPTPAAARANPFGDDDDGGGSDDDGNPFGHSDNPFGEDSGDEARVVVSGGNPFGDDDDDDIPSTSPRSGNPFGAATPRASEGGDGGGGGVKATRARPVSTPKKKARALAVMRGWMVKYPLQYEGKAAAVGMPKKRFFVLTGNSLCYYDKLCNSQGLAEDGTMSSLLGMVFLSDNAMPEGKRCKAKAKGPRGIHVTAHFSDVAYLKLEAESSRVRDMWVGAMNEVLDREREAERERDDNPFA